MLIKCLLLIGLAVGSNTFPDGAPIDVCVKPRPNRPNHGQAKPQPVHTSPYHILQSAAHYGPGTQITGKVVKFKKYTDNWIYFKWLEG